MINWNNMDTLASYQALKNTTPIDLAAVMAGEQGGYRVNNYSASIGEGLSFNYGARPVDDTILAAL